MRILSAMCLLLCLHALALPCFGQIGPDSLQVLKDAAKAGSPAALYQLGVIYEEGRYERQNTRRALEYYQQASELQYDSARFALGRLYELGKGVDQDFAQAVSYYELSIAKKPHAEALYRLGTLYQRGSGVPAPDPRKAADLYLDAWRFGYLPAQLNLEAMNVDSLANHRSVSYVYYKATKGDAQSQYFTGRLFEQGVGLPKDPKKAFDYYQKSAAQGFVKADVALGDLYAKGIAVQRNMRIAVKHYLKAANEGDDEAVARLKKLDVDKELDPSSIEYLSYKALAGEAPNQYRLYLRYFNGDGVPPNYEAALDYCQRSADAGYEKAMMAMANMYYRGIIVNPDPKSAFYWYRKSALVGNDSALYMMGEMYAAGQGVEKSEPKAVRYYLAAANNGVTPALQRLSQYDLSAHFDANDLEYMKYKAVKGDMSAQMAVGRYYHQQDESDCVRWFTLAADAGNGEAQALLGEIYYTGKCNMPKDNEEALRLFTLAARQKEPLAFRYLADMYVKNLIPSSNDNLEVAFQMANEYLTLKKGKLAQEDAHLYRIMGDIYLSRNDYSNAIIYYTEYVTMYDESLNEPLALVQAFEARAKSYSGLRQFSSAALDLDLALMQLEANKDHESIRNDYNLMRGYYLVEKARAYLGMEHYFKACNTLQEAIKMKAKVPQDLVDTCLKN